MSFTRVNPAGWVFPDPITAAQINQLDINVSNAIDGASGGVYVPTGDIELQGTYGIKLGSATLWPKLSSRTVHRVLSMAKFHETYDTSGPWTWQSGQWVQNAGGAAVEAIVFCGDNLVEGGQLKGLRVWLKGSAGHGALPATMPAISVTKVTAAGVDSVLGASIDASATVVAYEGAHYIDLAFTPDTAIDESSGTRYYVTVTGEWGTNSQDGLKIISAALLFDLTTLRPGG